MLTAGTCADVAVPAVSVGTTLPVVPGTPDAADDIGDVKRAASRDELSVTSLLAPGRKQ